MHPKEIYLKKPITEAEWEKYKQNPAYIKLADNGYGRNKRVYVGFKIATMESEYRLPEGHEYMTDSERMILEINIKKPEAPEERDDNKMRQLRADLTKKYGFRLSP